ncbi:SDR family NAD(P)-dependent oxidoreductase [Dactylosporangium sp. NPDC049742]|uniref:SDR family NAD(P)-dependent oxidoreductase n=1 Tax=Dactylosporangium sp. NPDC049742 TaxID=3154737 RepID=UPI003416697D
MDLQLAGRLVAVTGAGAGIGRAAALQLAAEGARLVLASRDPGRLEALAAQAREAGAPEVTVVAADLTTTGGVAALSAAAARRAPLWGLLACVGSTPIGTFDEIDDTAWQTAFTTKFLGSVRVMRAAAALMRDGDGGRIVLVAGNAARDAPPGMVTSTAVNAALDGLVASAGRFFAPHGIGVAGLHPGPTRTGRYTALLAHRAATAGVDEATAAATLDAQIPAGHPAEPADVAAAAAYLLSPRAAHIVATSITVDGGQTR